MNTAAVTQLSLNLLLTLALNAFLQLIESFQLLSFQLLMDFDIPANVQITNQLFFLFINADVLDPQWTTGLIFNFDIEYSYVESAFDQNHKLFLNKQVFEGGFEMFNPVYNLGGLFLILVFVFIQALVVSLSWLTIKFVDKLLNSFRLVEGGKMSPTLGQKLGKSFKAYILQKQGQIFFNSFVLICKESMMHMILAGILFMNLPHDLQKEMKVSAPRQ